MTTGIIQPNIISNEIEKNLLHCEELMRSLADTNNGIQIFLLPEMFATGFPAIKEQAELPETGRIQTWMRQIASELNAVVVGTAAVKEPAVSDTTPAAASPADEDIYNRLIWMRPTGEYFTYDKKHLFGAEKEIYKEGNRILTIQEQGWNFRINICYDLRFPVWCKNRRLYGDTLDYDVAIFPASWPVSRISVWKTLLPARAVENLAYSIGINRCGKDISGTRYNGQSIISDHQGNIITQLDENPQAVAVTLERQHLDRLRAHITVAQDWDEFELKC
jgi:predicted amidohydrolase